MPSFRLYAEDFARFAIVGTLVEQANLPDKTVQVVHQFAEHLTEALINQQEFSDVLDVLLLPAPNSIRLEIDGSVINDFQDVTKRLEERDDSVVQVTPTSVMMGEYLGYGR